MRRIDMTSDGKTTEMNATFAEMNENILTKLADMKGATSVSTDLYRAKLSESLYLQSPDFNLTDPNLKLMSSSYNCLHDPHLKAFFSRPQKKETLLKCGLITEENMVPCSLKEFNRYMDYIQSVKRSWDKVAVGLSDPSGPPSVTTSVGVSSALTDLEKAIREISSRHSLSHMSFIGLESDHSLSTIESYCESSSGTSKSEDSKLNEIESSLDNSVRQVGSCEQQSVGDDVPSENTENIPTQDRQEKKSVKSTCSKLRQCLRQTFCRRLRRQKSDTE